VICGIDPGREKFGIAFGSVDELMFSAIAPREKMGGVLECLATGDFEPMLEWRMEGRAPNGMKPSLVCLGNGTSHGIFKEKLEAMKIDCALTDERMTTLEARNLYWRLHRPSGIARMIPKSLRIPPRPIDDLAAWAILQRACRDVANRR
jgi:RNase H-fold protein (predicted Holliday junction resolvase)